MSSNPEAKAIIEMLTNLRTAIDSVQPLTHPLVVLSVPDFEVKYHYASLDRYKVAMQEANLEIVWLKPSSRGAP